MSVASPSRRRPPARIVSINTGGAGSRRLPGVRRLDAALVSARRVGCHSLEYECDVEPSHSERLRRQSDGGSGWGAGLTTCDRGRGGVAAAMGDPGAERGAANMRMTRFLWNRETM